MKAQLTHISDLVYIYHENVIPFMSFPLKSLHLMKSQLSINSHFKFFKKKKERKETRDFVNLGLSE